jgi:hypothetical protein
MQPVAQDGDRWTACFYDTVIGPAANWTAHNSSAQARLGSMDAAVLTKAWLATFELDDPIRGGCPDRRMF